MRTFSNSPLEDEVLLPRGCRLQLPLQTTQVGAISYEVIAAPITAPEQPSTAQQLPITASTTAHTAGKQTVPLPQAHQHFVHRWEGELPLWLEARYRAVGLRHLEVAAHGDCGYQAVYADRLEHPVRAHLHFAGASQLDVTESDQQFVKAKRAQCTAALTGDSDLVRMLQHQQSCCSTTSQYCRRLCG